MAGVKRKRRGGSGYANPLFIKWVEELRDDAKERGLKSHHTYSKALNSIKKYPLLLKSGAEAKILDHVGEKLAKFLDTKLAEHQASKEDSDGDHDDADPAPCGRGSSDASSSNRNEGREPETPPAKKKKSAQREYIPTYRSGPYALIIALYNASEKPSWKGYLSKAELISDAQPLCDKSFTVPDAGSYYTAWSSMSSITTKGLVLRRSNPPKFSLTENGEAMAQRLLRGSNMATAATTPTTTATTHHTPQFHNPESAPSSRPRGKGGVSRTSTKGKGAARERVTSSSSSVSTASGSSRIKESPCARFVESPPSSIPSNLSDSCSPTNLGTVGVASPSPTPDSPDVTAAGLRFWYVDNSEKLVLAKDLAAVTVNDTVSVGFCIKCKQTNLDYADVLYSIDESREPGDGYVYAYLTDMDAPERARPPHHHPPQKQQQEPVASISRPREMSDPSTRASVTTSSSTSARPSLTTSSASTPAASSYRTSPLPSSEGTSTSNLITLSDSEGEADVLPLRCRVGQPPASSLSSSNGEGAGPSSALGSGRGGSDGPRTKVTGMSSGSVEVGGAQRNRPAAGEVGGAQRSRPAAGEVGGAQRSRPAGGEVGGAQRSRPTGGEVGGAQVQVGGDEEGIAALGNPEFVFMPGTFEVVLLVDSSESTASRKSSSQFRGILLQELGKNGVMFDVRRLTVGDFLWVAREKKVPKPGCVSLPVSREVVLEYIVERKRMDDLASSIIDGRFSEQKFRLKNSGVLHPVYLVEEHGDSAHSKIDLHTLNQAVANTQVVDGFFVKRTKDIRESVAYLTIMTRSLQLAYSGKTIKCYSWDVVAELNKGRRHMAECTLTSHEVHSMEFSRFNEASLKTKVLTVQEMFARHLLQLPGLSADKAVVILQEYPTLHSLRQAYSECSSEGNRKNLIAELRYGRTKSSEKYDRRGRGQSHAHNIRVMTDDAKFSANSHDR